MKRLFFCFIAFLAAMSIAAAEYTDSVSKVSYTYDPAGSTAEVKHGGVYMTDSGGGWFEAGSPEAKGDVAILSTFAVEGKDYSVDRIGDYAFAGLMELTSVTIPATVTNIGMGAFSSCVSLRSVCLAEGLRVIERKAFQGCPSLESVVLPEGLERIESRAFSSCGLKEIIIPASVNAIANQVFLRCDALSSVSVADGNPVYDSREGCNAIIETSENQLFYGCKGTRIPTSVTSIGYGAFFSCQGLTEIAIPGSVTEIGESTFFSCPALRKVSLSEGLKTIRRSAFWYCGLSSLTIPASVTAIEPTAFWSRSLTSLTSLIERPFEVDQICDQTGYNTVTLYVPQGTREKYMAAEGWKNFAHIVEMEKSSVSDAITDIGSAPIPAYDLQGRRLAGEPARGMYIKDGRKYVK